MKKLLAVTSLLLLLPTVGSAAISDGPLHTLLWNRVEAVTIVDSFAVSISTNGIAVSIWNDDVEAFQTVTVDQTEFTPVQIRQMDGQLIVKTSDYRLISYDLANLPTLDEIWRIDPGVQFNDFSVMGDDVLVSSWFDGVWQFQRSGNSATFLDSSMVGILMTQLDVEATEVFVLDEYNGVMRMDVAAGTVAASFIDYLYSPRQIRSFVRTDSTVTMLTRDGSVLIGQFGPGGNEIVDSLVDIDPPQRVYVSENHLVMVAPRQIEIVDRNDFAMRSTLPIDQVGPDGDIFELDGRPHLVLPRVDGGMLLVDIENPTKPKPAAFRAGPIRALSVRDGHLFTGGGSNPIDVYTFDTSLAPTLAYTMFSELGDVRTMLTVGDSLIAYYGGLNRVAFILDALEPDSFYIERTFHLSDTLAGDLIYLPTTMHDTLRALVAVNEYSLQAYTISDSGVIDPKSAWGQHGRIGCASVSDSLVVIGTVKRQLWVHRIDSSFAVHELARADLPEVPTEIVRRDNQIIVFANTTMIVYELDSTGTLLPRYSDDLPISVVDAQLANDRLYTAGGDGIGVFSLDGEFPALEEYGGLPANIIAVEGEILAASDGGAVQIYRVEAPSDNPDPQPIVPESYALFQNFPNPFNAETVIRFSLPEAAEVEIVVYNTLGRTVKTIVNRNFEAGIHEVPWDGKGNDGSTVASGVYLYQIRAGGFVAGKKMVLLK